MVLVATKKRKPTIHDKRRHGHHQARDEHYHKAYWPYLPMALIVGLGVLANTFWGTIQQHVLSYATSMSGSGLLQETNEERTAAGLSGLTLNAKLNEAAQAKANDMATRNYWSHNTPDGDAPWVFFNRAGYDYQTAGENLAYGFDSSTEAVIGWMNSPGHKANILNTTYTEVGFGIADVPNYQDNGEQTVVVAMYGNPHVASATTTQPAVPPAAQAKVSPSASQTTPVNQATASPASLQTPEINTTPVAVNDQPASNESSSAAPTVTSQPVSRIQLLSGGGAPWSMFAVSALVAVCALIFFLKHGLLWHRVLVKSEAFVHKHPLLDISLVAIVTIGFILTRSDGLIR